MCNSLVTKFVGLGLLAGCGEQSPQTKCQHTLSELRGLESKINQSKIDIEGGYKVHYSKQPTTSSGTCSTHVPGYIAYLLFLHEQWHHNN
jgi:hypothetical protein